MRGDRRREVNIGGDIDKLLLLKSPSLIREEWPRLRSSVPLSCAGEGGDNMHADWKFAQKIQNFCFWIAAVVIAYGLWQAFLLR